MLLAVAPHLNTGRQLMLLALAPHLDTGRQLMLLALCPHLNTRRQVMLLALAPHLNTGRQLLVLFPWALVHDNSKIEIRKNNRGRTQTKNSENGKKCGWHIKKKSAGLLSRRGRTLLLKAVDESPKERDLHLYSIHNPPEGNVKQHMLWRLWS